MKISHLEWITGVTFTVKNDEERKTMILLHQKDRKKGKILQTLNTILFY